MTKIKIDKDVPHPAGFRNLNRKYPWAEMEVGDSFWVEVNATQATSVVSAGATWAKRRNLRIRFARLREGNGYRFWRVE